MKRTTFSVFLMMIGLAITLMPLIISLIIKIDFGSLFSTLFGVVGAGTIMLSALMIIVRAIDTGADNLINNLKDDEILWFLWRKGGQFEIVKAYQEKLGVMSNKDRTMYVQDVGKESAGIIAGHPVRLVIETDHTVVDPEMAAYATIISQKAKDKKLKIHNLFSLHNYGRKLMGDEDKKQKSIEPSKELRDHIINNPVEKNILAENIGFGKVIDLSDFESYKLTYGTPIGISTLIKSEKLNTMMDNIAHGLDRRKTWDAQKLIPIIMTAAIGVIIIYMVVSGAIK